jgi:DNA mismatch repair protein MutS
MSLIDQNTSKYNSKKIKGKCELCGKDGDDIHHLQYQKEADNTGYIKTHHKNHKANLINICNKCHDEIHEKDKKLKKVKTTKGYKLMEIE